MAESEKEPIIWSISHLIISLLAAPVQPSQMPQDLWLCPIKPLGSFAAYFPTDPFTILEPRDQEIGGFYRVWRILKLQNCERVGRVPSPPSFLNPSDLESKGRVGGINRYDPAIKQGKLAAGSKMWPGANQPHFLYPLTYVRKYAFYNIIEKSGFIGWWKQRQQLRRGLVLPSCRCCCCCCTTTAGMQQQPKAEGEKRKNVGQAVVVAVSRGILSSFF